MKKRDFLISGSASLLLGCQINAQKKPKGKSVSDAAPHDAGAKFEDAGQQDADAGDGGGDLPLTCGEHTAANVEGPFFTPDSPENRLFRVDDAPGQRLLITGRVLDQNRQPIEGAVVDFWHADADGAYDNEGYTYRGHQKTLPGGHFSLSTIVPGRYLNGGTYRPAHIHVKVGAEGHSLLTTQLYFPDDPYNESDAFIVDSLIMEISEGIGEQLASFDFVI